MTALRAAPWTLLALLGAACSELPGEVLGTYKVTMTLEENSCGASAVYSLDKRRYSVELRSDERFGYWRIAGKTPIQGTYEAPDFAFEFSSIVANSGPDAGPNGCRLQQHDQVTGSLELDARDAGSDATLEDAALEDAADEDAALEDAEVDDNPFDDTFDAGKIGGTDAGAALIGEHSMTISGAAGTDCRADALAPNGPFERLPCVVRYSLRGVPTKPF
jgi:hypothetical protein